MFEIKLTGCTPEPLMSYLKALGVFRLVAEQADPHARLSWHGGVATLHTTLDKESIQRFFLDEYRPTPIVAPWNGGSGFHGGGSEPLDAIQASNADRLELYRNTIRTIRSIPLQSLEKEQILATCRNELPDDVVNWLDCCFALGLERVSYFPLLGTGGNDGRLEFTNNFMQRVADVVSFNVDKEPPKNSPENLSASLFADSLVSLGKSAVGQFNPGGIGGPNGIQGKFEADSKVNPWDFVFMIEGTLLFAGAVARRLGVGGPMKAVFPFSVESIAVGYGSSTASEETSDGSRSELWLPLWDQPSTYREVQRLFAEGRAQLGRRQARNSVEFSLAVNLLGVSRGIKSFSRYGFLKRNGLAFLAAPLGRMQVTLRPQAKLLDDPELHAWLLSFRRACSDKEKTPARYQTALRSIDRAMFAFTNRSEQGNDAPYLLDVLRAIGRAERTFALAGLSWLKDKQYGWKVRPLHGLSSDWLKQADDQSPEFALASSLAGIIGTSKGEVAPLRQFIEPVEVTKFVNWKPESTSAVWSQRSLTSNLAAVFRRRMLAADQAGVTGVPLESRVYAGLQDITAFLNGETDDEKLNDLIWGCLCIEAPSTHVFRRSGNALVPFEYAVPRLLVSESHYKVKPGERRWERTPDTPKSLLSPANAKPHPDVFHALCTGRSDAVSRCVDLAARRLKAGGLLVHGHRNRQQAGHSLAIQSPLSAERLLAAMLFPLSDHDLNQIANSVLFLPESAE
ncbi:MAG: type I-U CRISPR-associated protein Csx17 [Planctomycetaceae bacterium]